MSVGEGSKLMAANVKVETRKSGNVSIITLKGDITSEGETLLKDTYQTLTREGAVNILFDLKQSAYINTSGIAVLISIVMEAKKAGQKILVSGVSPHYRKVFELVRFSLYVTMFDTEEAALASVAPTPAVDSQPEPQNPVPQEPAPQNPVVQNTEPPKPTL